MENSEIPHSTAFSTSQYIKLIFLDMVLANSLFIQSEGNNITVYITYKTPTRKTAPGSFNKHLTTSPQHVNTGQSSSLCSLPFSQKDEHRQCKDSTVTGHGMASSLSLTL